MKSTPLYRQFLKDVLICSLSSFGGPEAHYGIFSSILVEQKHYLSADELQELIALYALVPGPSSTQTITGIGYHLGGIKLAILTFFVWALPAIVIMSAAGLILAHINSFSALTVIARTLPYIAIAFIALAAWMMSRKSVKDTKSLGLFGGSLLLAYLVVPLSMWAVPALLVSGGLIYTLAIPVKEDAAVKVHFNWLPLLLLVILIIGNEVLRVTMNTSIVLLLSSMIRFGYSIIGGGQIVIPLMIQEIVQSQNALSLVDFLSGYAIDQAIPGPLFSFAAFVTSRSLVLENGAFWWGILGGILIFIPGTLLVFFIHPLWHQLRLIKRIKVFLNGVSIVASALIVMTLLNQIIAVTWSLNDIVFTLAILIGLLTKKIPAPLLVVLGMMAGYLFSLIH